MKEETKEARAKRLKKEADDLLRPTGFRIKHSVPEYVLRDLLKRKEREGHQARMRAASAKFEIKYEHLIDVLREFECWCIRDLERGTIGSTWNLLAEFACLGVVGSGNRRSPVLVSAE